jgi:MFS family permease
VRELLAERNFRLLLAAQFIAQAADGFVQVVLADVLLLDPMAQDTPGRILALTALTLVPYSLVAPFLGVFVDRLARRALLVWTNVARAVLLLTLPLWSAALPGVTELYVGILGLLGLGRLFLTTKGASLPVILHERSLLRGNAVSGGGGMIAALIGGVAGAFVANFTTPHQAFAVAGAFYIGAAVLARGISTTLRHSEPRREPIGDAFARIGRELLDGLAAVTARPRAALPLTGIFLLRTAGMLVAFGAILVIRAQFPEIADESNRLLSGGVALAATGAGAFAAVATAPLLGTRLNKPWLILLGFAISGAGIIALGGIQSVVALSVLTFIGGYGGSLTKVATDAQVQEAMPDTYRGRAFALYDILYNVASVAAAGIIVGFAGSSLRTVLVLCGVATLGIAGILAGAMRRAGMLERVAARPAF